MFCQNCGTKNEDDAIFCASCGTKLEDNSVQNIVQNEGEVPGQSVNDNQINQTVNAGQDNQTVDDYQASQSANGYWTSQSVSGGYSQGGTVVSREPIKIDKMAMIAAVELIVAIVAIVVFFKVGNKAFGYKNVAENYFKATMAADWKTAYGYLDITESEFISEDMYEAAKSESSAVEYNTYTLENSEESAVSADVEISYREKTSSTTSNRHISLNKQKDKNFLFFDSWKVSSEEDICTDYSISTPEGATVVVDGIELSNAYLTSTENGYQHFTIPSIFCGNHQIKISMEGFESETADVYIYSSYDYYSVSSFSMNKESQEELIDLAYANMQAILNAAVAGDDFAVVESLFTDDVSAYARENYEYLKNCFATQDDLEGITDVSISNVTGTFSYNEISSGKIYASVVMEYNYDVSFYDRDWWTDELYADSYSSSDSQYYEFVYINGEWLMSDSDMPYFYYY